MSPRQRGFTLLEMAITLAIVGFLLGGLMMTLGAQQDVSRVQETRRLLTQAREALYGFAMQNGRLPCPAAPGAASTGLERTANATANGCGGAGSMHGTLPWATLGLPEGDAWGRRFTYSVTPRFARTVQAYPLNQYGCLIDPTAAPTQAAFALCSRGDYSVQRTGAGGAFLIQAPAGAVAVIVSHGPNGAGGRMTGGSAAVAATGDELENADADVLFFDDSEREGYDDLVEWVVPSILMNRMVQAGRLP